MLLTIKTPDRKRRTIASQRIFELTGVNADKILAKVNAIPPIYRDPYRSASTPVNGETIMDPQKKDPISKLCS